MPTAQVLPLNLKASLPNASHILKGSVQTVSVTSIFTFAHRPPGMDLGFSVQFLLPATLPVYPPSMWPERQDRDSW